MTAPDRMCAPTSRALLEHDDGNFLPGCGGELLQADGGGKAGGARADDDHVELHGLARRQVGSHRAIGVAFPD